MFGGGTYQLGQSPWFFCTPKKSIFMLQYPNNLQACVIELPNPKIVSTCFTVSQNYWEMQSGFPLRSDFEIPLGNTTAKMDVQFVSQLEQEHNNLGEIRMIQGKENIEREKNELKILVDNHSVDDLLNALHYKLNQRK